jgi:hypothetical protein
LQKERLPACITDVGILNYVDFNSTDAIPETVDNIELTPKEKEQVEALNLEQKSIEDAVEASFNASVERLSQLRSKWKDVWEQLHVTYNLDRDKDYRLSNSSGPVTLIEKD